MGRNKLFYSLLDNVIAFQLGITTRHAINIFIIVYISFENIKYY